MIKLTICLLVLFPVISVAQKMQINYGLAVGLQAPSIAVKVLQNKYDYAIAYTHEGYWESNHINYLFVAVKGGLYYKGSIALKRKKTGIWSTPIIRFNKSDPLNAKKIIDYIDNSGLWLLDRDSLNNQNIKTEDGKVRIETISDATNFQFEQISYNNVLIVDAYAPDYYLTNFHSDVGRKLFIQVKDNFLKMYKLF